jgi:hypothetical protein
MSNDKYDKVLEVLNRPMREDVQVWLDVANKLPTHKEVKASLHPVLQSRILELVEEWEKGGLVK